MVTQEWVPRHIRTEGETGEDCCDLFARGITGEKYLQWLRDRLVEGPPTVEPESGKVDAPGNDQEGEKESDKSPGWPPLVSLDTPDLPRLSSMMLPGFAGKFARALSQATETPIELPSGMVLATCATAVARRCKVQVESGYIEPCNIWELVLLPPGHRKSVVQSATTAPLVAWEHSQAITLDPEIKKQTSKRMTLEARAKKLRTNAAKAKDSSEADRFAKEAADIEAELPVIPTVPQLWTSDATPERLGTLLADNDECMSWHSSEGGIFEIMAGRYSNNVPNIDLLLKSHSGDPERVDRGSRPPVYLRHPALTIGISTQPDVVRGLASKPGFRGRGLLGRILYLLPPSDLGYRKLETIPVPTAIQQAYANGITAMLDWEPGTDSAGRPSRHVIRLSVGAAESRLAYAHEIEVKMRPGADMEHVTDWAGKAPGAAVRLAGVLHGIEHAHGKPWEYEVTQETMDAAIQFMRVVAPHSLAALDLMGADTGVAAARHVWSWVQRSRKPLFTVSEAFNALKGTFPRVKHVRAVLEVLEERGYVEIKQQQAPSGPGRPPSPGVLVRPEFARKWK